MISVEKVRIIETNNMHKIRIDTSLINEYYISSCKGDHWAMNGEKEHIYVEVNCKSGGYQLLATS